MMEETPLILDGKLLAKEISADLKLRVAALKEKNAGKPPALATILVGEDPASATYVKMKGNACKRVGMESIKVVMDTKTTTVELLEKIEELNNDSNVHGILLQHPVPSQIDERACFDAIALEKDVDGVTTAGFGRMAMGLDAYGSATPQGIMDLLQHYNVQISGKHAVVVGRSPILGKPVAAMLLNKNATVTVCHSKTEDLPEVVAQADILIAAVGKPEFIRGDWIRQGAVIVDAGYHPKNRTGDVNLQEAVPRSSAYTPVPGGVGPMTIATLIRQTVCAEGPNENPATLTNRSVAEAVACGLPVVGYRKAILVDSHSEFVEAAHSLAATPELQQRLGRASRDLALEHLDRSDNHREFYKSWYKKVS